jgi:hypothetical protein
MESLSTVATAIGALLGLATAAINLVTVVRLPSKSTTREDLTSENPLPRARSTQSAK